MFCSPIFESSCHQKAPVREPDSRDPGRIWDWTNRVISLSIGLDGSISLSHQLKAAQDLGKISHFTFSNAEIDGLGEEASNGCREREVRRTSQSIYVWEDGHPRNLELDHTIHLSTTLCLLSYQNVDTSRRQSAHYVCEIMCWICCSRVAFEWTLHNSTQWSQWCHI